MLQSEGNLTQRKKRRKTEILLKDEIFPLSARFSFFQYFLSFSLFLIEEQAHNTSKDQSLIKD